MMKNGIYPTMITPYTKEGKPDEEALIRLVDWYAEKGCAGIFAACQSSEIFYLTAEERSRIVEVVKKETLRLAAQSGKAPMTVLASGHVADDAGQQVQELLMMADAGADAVVLISNRLDIKNTGDGQWIRELEQLLSRLPAELPLGVYECPTPYKRLFSEQMLRELIATDRFVFFKDTCCDPVMLENRCRLLKGSRLKLFNANAQTFLYSLQCGGSGYCGIMANFHPELYVWLYENYISNPEETKELENILSMTAFSESLAYPITAKYYLNSYEKLAMEPLSRSCSIERFGEYDKLVMEQFKELTDLLVQRYVSA